MKFYPHHIGDWNNATRHLTRVEQSVYRDLTELYYDTEMMLTLDLELLKRRVLCHSEEEKKALIDVLNEFFVKTDEGYFHERCDAEITKYRANTSAKAKAGIASALARQQKRTRVEHVLNTRGTDVQQTNNQEPITNNVTSEAFASSERVLTNDDVFNKKPKTLKPNISNTREREIEFDKFWGHYPKKVGKGDAEKAFKKINLEDMGLIIDSVRKQSLSSDWRKDNGQFIPNPSTWLNQKRWLDEGVVIEGDGLSDAGRKTAAAAMDFMREDLNNGGDDAGQNQIFYDDDDAF